VKEQQDLEQPQSGGGWGWGSWTKLSKQMHAAAEGVVRDVNELTTSFQQVTPVLYNAKAVYHWWSTLKCPTIHCTGRGVFLYYRKRNAEGVPLSFGRLCVVILRGCGKPRDWPLNWESCQPLWKTFSSATESPCGAVSPMTRDPMAFPAAGHHRHV
jgi:hypothetical protein